MKTVASYQALEDLGRVRLSKNFFMREFLYSEIAAWHGMRNVPDLPEKAIHVGKKLCEELLEPILETFGKVHVRSGYRSPAVNAFGNENNLNCASNSANFAGHIWDHPDSAGGYGATACIVVPVLVDHVQAGGSWTDMAWWVHDHLPYSSLCFFSNLTAFNINWHEVPRKEIKSFTSPKGCLTRPGMPNHSGSHSDCYKDLLIRSKRGHTRSNTSLRVSPGAEAYSAPPAVAAVPEHSRPVQLSRVVVQSVVQRVSAKPEAQTAPGTIRYRAVHSRTSWRKVNSHRSLQAAIFGSDGAAGLFEKRVRIDYDKHGEPLFVLVWAEGQSDGYVLKPAPGGAGMLQKQIPVQRLHEFEARGGCDPSELAALF